MRFGKYKSRKNKKRAAIAKRRFIVSESDRSDKIKAKAESARFSKFMRRFTGDK